LGFLELKFFLFELTNGHLSFKLRASKALKGLLVVLLDFLLEEGGRLDLLLHLEEQVDQELLDFVFDDCFTHRKFGGKLLPGSVEGGSEQFGLRRLVGRWVAHI